MYATKNLFGILAIANVINPDVGEYLDYKNCNCRKKIVHKLLEGSSAQEFTDNFEEVKMA